MKPHDIAESVEEEIGRMPSYDEELRSVANWLKRHSTGIAGLEAFAVMIPAPMAIEIAGWLEDYANGVEQGRG